MRAVPVEETVSAGLIAVENEILAQQAHGFRRLVVKLGHGGDGHPVAPKQLSHRRASADLRQSAVLFVAQHRFGSSISVVEGGLSRGSLRDYFPACTWSHANRHPSYDSINSPYRGRSRDSKLI